MSTTCTAAPAFSALTARRRDAFGLPRIPAMLLPEGEHTPPAVETPPPTDPQTPPPAGGTEPPADKGFPENTSVSEMTPEQRAAYDQHKREQNRLRAQEWKAATDGRTAAQVKADLDELAALRQEKLTPSEKAIEAARAEGRREALEQANRTAVTALIDGALRGRGKTPEQIAKLTTHISPDSFVKDGAPDTAAILALADDIAGPVTGGGRGPNHGQGPREQTGQSRADAGKAEAQKRFSKPE